MGSSPLRPVTFCRFGYDESLTLDRVVQLIEQKELWAGELLQVDGAKVWTAARDVPQLRPYFGDGAGPPVDRRQRRPYERGERPSFRVAFTRDDPAEFDAAERAYVRFFGAMVVIFALFWLFLTVQMLSVESQSTRWPTTTGVALYTWRNDSGSTDVTYEYVVAHAHYRATGKLDYVRKGDQITVRYNPLRPERSTLTYGISGQTVGLVCLGGVFFAIGIGLVIFPKQAAVFFNASS